MGKKQFGSRSNAHGRGARGGGCSGKHKGKGGGGGGRGGGGGKKKPIKVVYISNPMRVTTSEAEFRALVQELTGREADPSKYSGTGGAVDVDESSGGSPAEPLGGALPSPGSTVESSDATGHVPAVAYDDDDEDSFPPQLIDNRYSVFSPPTFLYGTHNGGA